ncbi:DUF3140 domain-containing protein [Arthrobacter sp. NamB2]|uniref:DUF3140 domain-containing protein n=1 Tax=Arthrobacter sp. NamB2 TaxID=2576035 RepID=UPI0010CA14C0|nr:DUF3140 domain-containing protein [Arthrobacter sp. NamB2]TKV28649.1 DUF3140 domain-containing protein [Arthrobacter sp. NamB2]
MAQSTSELDEVWPRWKEAVNMTASELKKWLGTEESLSVGQKESDGGESVGHKSGKRIIEILGTKREDLDDDDVKHMHTVVGYVHRHLAQRPTKEDIESSKWRYSLMNWGHDPLKD